MNLNNVKIKTKEELEQEKLMNKIKSLSTQMNMSEEELIELIMKGDLFND